MNFNSYVIDEHILEYLFLYFYIFESIMKWNDRLKGFKTKSFLFFALCLSLSFLLFYTLSLSPADGLPLLD